MGEYVTRHEVTTSGVYKGQGRNQRELMTRAYWEFPAFAQRDWRIA
jgi:hypothetical protein